MTPLPEHRPPVDEALHKAGPWAVSSLAAVVAIAVVVSVALAAAAAGGAVAVREDPDLSVAPIARDGQVLVSFELSDGLTAEVRDAIQSGLPTTFSYEVELRRGMSAWFDRTIAAVTITATVRFDNLTRRYQMSRAVDGRVEDARPTEDSAAVSRWMTHFERMPLLRTSALEANAEYYVRVRAHTRPHSAWFFRPWDRGLILGHAQFTFIP
jgi:hypothetical protein